MPINQYELRLGNYIHDSNNPDRICKVFRLNCGIDYPITYSYGGAYEESPYRKAGLEYVKLTDDILNKCGFIRNGSYYEKGFFYIPILPTINGTEIMLVPNRDVAALELKYLHELQNLYRCSYGEELKINDL